MPKCKNCDKEMLVDPNITLTSMPPQNKYYCHVCDGSVFDHSVTGTYNFKPDFIDCTFSVTHEGLTYTEDVKYDLTAIELYKINRIKEIASVNFYMPDEVIKRIKSMGIERHFKVEEL